MIGALLALISCVGAWIAWRRHPTYSSTATFRVLAELVLLVVAGACAIFAVTKITEGKSFTLQMIALISVIVLVTLTLIFSITAITTPKLAKLTTTLPPGVPVVNMYRRRVLHFLRASLIFMAAAAALCLIPGVTRFIAATVLAMGLLLGSILLPTAYLMARKFDRSATAMTLNPWLHWHYSPEEWQTWKTLSVERLQAQPASFVLKRDWRRVLWLSVGTLVATLLLTPGSWIERVGWALACILMVMLFVEAAAWDARRAPHKLKVRLASCPPDAYFGDDGMMCDGLFFTWLGADVYLTAASMDGREPRSLWMEFEKLVPNPYGSPNLVKLNQGVMIPKDLGADDLSLLRASLGSRCPAAKISL
jgi:hypothetical protein